MYQLILVQFFSKSKLIVHSSIHSLWCSVCVNAYHTFFITIIYVIVSFSIIFAIHHVIKPVHKEEIRVKQTVIKQGKRKKNAQINQKLFEFIISVEYAVDWVHY